MFKGIDVSSAQGYIDWKQVAQSGIQFAIIRAGYGRELSQKDTQYENNIKNALANNIKVGIYWFSYADSVQAAIQEANVCNQIVAPYKSKITMGIWFDWEYDSANNYLKIHKVGASNSLINQMNVAFMNQIKSFGYKIGTYFNNDYKNSILNSATLNMGYKWFAYYSGTINMYDIQQTSDKGHVNGISNAVDLDVCYNNNLIQNAIAPFKSDTNGEFSIQPLGEYTFKITTSAKPDFATGNNNLLKTEFIKQVGNDYYIKVISTGGTGSIGIYVNGKRIAVADIAYLPFKSDTNCTVNIKKGQCYQAKITCIRKPSICCGTPNVLKVDFVKQVGQDWFIKFTAIGNIGQASGVYINGSKQAVFAGKVI